MDIFGEIYKITNIQNQKVYIGQSIRPIQQRFRRHINDAMNNALNTHFARAIRKYGPENFVIEAIDNATTQEELNQKEQYWIRYYDSIKCGYNETDAICKCGGNTYQSKTEEELALIREKLSESKMGKNNPMARRVKRTDITTGEEVIFDTISSCAKACGISSGKTSITTRLNGTTKSPFKGKWIFEYYDE